MPVTDAGARRLRRDVWVSVVQLILVGLLLAVFAVFLMSFAGEFLIVVKGIWLIYAFMALILVGSVASLVLAVRSHRAESYAGEVSARVRPPALRAAWLIAWSSVLILLAVPILSVGRTLVLGAMGAVPTAALGVLAIPFLGFAAMLVVGGVSGIVRALRHRPAALMRGAILVGGPFVVLFAGFAILAVSWTPQWTDGVEQAPLFTPGDQPGQAYRIPAMAVLPGDTVLAFAESRQEAMSDLLNIDIVERRSLDGGRTWTPIQVVEDLDTQTVHSPTVVFDDATKTVWLAFCTDYQRLHLTSSMDRGKTWTPSRDLSSELALPDGTYCHNGPGSGVQLTDGRLVIPTNQGETRVLTSADHGATWQLGGPMGGGEEPQVWVKADGSLCTNLRNAAGQPRLVTCSSDSGETWEPIREDAHLQDAGTQASIMRSPAIGSQPADLLFANPGSPYRANMTLRRSEDDGQTWPAARLVYDGAAGYSQLGVLSDGTILVLFETGRFDLRESITLARVDPDWLTQGAVG
jgi:sialidase-1